MSLLEPRNAGPSVKICGSVDIQFGAPNMAGSADVMIASSLNNQGLTEAEQLLKRRVDHNGNSIIETVGEAVSLICVECPNNKNNRGECVGSSTIVPGQSRDILKARRHAEEAYFGRINRALIRFCQIAYRRGNPNDTGDDR